jgi:hypothetical protein
MHGFIRHEHSSPVGIRTRRPFISGIWLCRILPTLKDRIAQSGWMTKQVSALVKLGYQIAGKGGASVLVALHNRLMFNAGLLMIGTFRLPDLAQRIRSSGHRILHARHRSGPSSEIKARGLAVRTGQNVITGVLQGRA